MPRRLLLFSLVCLIVVMASTTGRPARADKIQSLQAKIADAQVQESRLQSDIGSIESRIRTLESQVGGVSTKLDALQHDLDLQQVRLHRIRQLYRFQTEQLDFFSHEENLNLLDRAALATLVPAGHAFRIEGHRFLGLPSNLILIVPG